MKISLQMLAILAVFSVLGAGCSKSEPTAAVPVEQKQSLERFQELVQKSGGVWERLTPEEQRELIENQAGGDEEQAKRLLYAAAQPGVPIPGPKNPR